MKVDGRALQMERKIKKALRKNRRFVWMPEAWFVKGMRWDRIQQGFEIHWSHGR